MWESHLSEYLNGNIYFGYVSHVLLLLDDQREAFYHSPVFISVSMCRCSATLSQVPVNVFSIPCKKMYISFLTTPKSWGTLFSLRVFKHFKTDFMNNLHVETFSEPQQKEITRRCAYLLLFCSIDLFLKMVYI